MNNLKRIELKKQKLVNLKRNKTFDNKLFINLDTDISEMDVNIKKYETIKKKNLFLDTEPKLKNRLIRNNTYKTKDESNSITTDSSLSHKKVRIKKVTFSTVEIIRVEKFKKYNAKNNFPKANIEKNMEEVKYSIFNKDDKPSCLVF
jgi:hypothetical protein